MATGVPDKVFNACVAYVMNTGSNVGASAFDKKGRYRRREYSKSTAESFVLAFLDVFFKGKCWFILLLLLTLTVLLQEKENATWPTLAPMPLAPTRCASLCDRNGLSSTRSTTPRCAMNVDCQKSRTIDFVRFVLRTDLTTSVTARFVRDCDICD